MPTLFGDERAQFEAALRARNLVPPKDLVADGKFHRVNTRERNGRGDGCYVLFGDGTRPAGGLENHQDGRGWEKFVYMPKGREATPAEDAEAAAKTEAARKRRDADRERDYGRVAEKARRLWDAASPATAHPYLTGKRVAAHDVRTLYGKVVVPVRNADGIITSLHFIAADGSKRNLTGGRLGGGSFTIGGASSDIIVCEGFATAASLQEATDATVVAALSDANLLPVAEAARKQHPDASITIAADDDHKTAGNPGLTWARKAARAIGAKVAVPEFGQNRRAKDTDFNDLADLLGKVHVAKAVVGAVTPDELLVRLILADPQSAVGDQYASELVDLQKRDLVAFERLRAALKAAKVRVKVFDEVIKEEAHGEDEERANVKQADRLVQLALKGAKLFHTSDTAAFADITIGAVRQTWSVMSTGFRRWLRYEYYKETKSSPSAEAMQSALGTLDAKAVHDAPQRDVHVRIAELDGRLYLDLCDDGWRAVEITAEGWTVLSEPPPVRFRRQAGMLPLPLPRKGGHIDELRPFLNLRADEEKGDADFVLVVSYLAEALRPRPPYPVLAVSGEHGAAKTTLVELLRRLVDPNTTALRTMPREDRDLYVAVNNSHLLAFDNVSGLPTAMSDTLCRVADGAGFAVRALYTDADEALFGGARPILLNGIEDFVTRPDLADRTIVLSLDRLDEARCKAKDALLAEFDAAAPRILGALLNIVAHGLKQLPDVRLDRLPRMAGFAIWATACETAFATAGAFMRAFDRNRAEGDRAVLEADVVALTVVEFMTGRSSWEGTAMDLLGLLAGHAGEAATKRKSWPGAPHVLSGRLRRAAPGLRKVGITIATAHSGNRTISLFRATQRDGDEASQASGASKDNDINGLDWTLAEEPSVQAEEPGVHLDAPSAQTDASQKPSVQPNHLKKRESVAPDASDASFSYSSGAGAQTQHPGTGNGQDGEVQACAQCLAADGQVLRFKSDSGWVRLHRECRRFWLKAHRP